MKFKKILFIFVLTIVLFPINIKANGKEANIRELKSGHTDIAIEKARENSNEIILCSYGCDGDNIGTNGAQCGNENESFSAILYDAEQNSWNIEMNLYLYQLKPNPYLGAATLLPDFMLGASKYVKYVKDEDAPAKIYNYSWTGIKGSIQTNAIYYGESRNVNQGWSNSEGYNNLKNNLQCPAKIYYDHTIDSGTITVKDKTYSIYVKNDMEICYENYEGGCSTRNEADKTQFGSSNSLNYSFADELGKTLDRVNADINASDEVNFLLNYYAAESDVCTAIGNNSGTQFAEMMEVKNFNNYINEEFRNYTSESPNKNSYTYENISKLRGSFGESINQKFEDLRINYKNKLGESTKYYVNKCNPGLSEEEVNSYVDQVTNRMSEKIEKETAQWSEKIDYTDLTCDELLGDVAEVISNAYFILEIIAIVIAVVLTVLDYAKVILSDGQDAMKKTNQKLIKRLIIVVVILLLPALVNLILSVFNIESFNSDNPLCKINK